MIKLFISIVFFTIPASLIYFNITHSSVRGRLLFTVLVILILIERVWETFFSVKEKKVFKYKGDWTLMFTLFIYFFVGLSVIFEFFLINKKIDIIISSLGIFILLFSAFIRFWSIGELGQQWSIHAVGRAKDKEKKLVLIKSGPYRYVRHPIYLATILELFGLALSFNTFYTIFLIILGAPFYLIRAKHEEKTLVEIFGDDYLVYKKEVSFFIPWKL